MFTLIGCVGKNEKSKFSDQHFPLLEVPGAFFLNSSPPTSQDVLLTWSASNNASSYTLIYYTNLNPSHVTVDDVSSPFLLPLSNGLTYHIMIQANNRIGATLSKEISVSPSISLPTHLAFSSLPSLTGNADSILSQQPKVEIQDSNNVVVDDNSTITIHGYSDSTCSTEVTNSISGNSINATSGISSFTALRILKTNIVALKAKSGTLESSCINGISILPGAINSLAFTTNPSPSSLNVGSVFTTQPIIKAYDTNSNIVANNSTATVALNGHDAINCGGSVISSALKGTTSAVLNNGVATFTDVGVVKPAAKSILATSGAFSTCFSPLTVNAGSPSATYSTIALSAGTANNSSNITVTITLKDNDQNPISGTTPDYKLLNSTGNYTVVSPCSVTNASGVSTCTFKTWRGRERIVQISSPTGLTSVMAKSTLNCGSFFAANEGSGSSVSPYLVSTIIQLDQLRCGTSFHYKLMNDFDLSGYDWFPNTYTTSIDVDGNHKTISNLSIVINFSDYSAINSSSNAAAFFSPVGGGYYGSYQTIKNLTFSNPIVTANGTLGTTSGTSAAIVCTTCGYQFDNIHVVNGQVSASDTVAGLILTMRTYEKTIAPFYQTPTELINSSFTGTISYTTTAPSVARYRWGIGGLVNLVTGGGANIKNNTFSGTIDGTLADSYGTTNVVGAIVSRVEHDSSYTLNDLEISNNQVINSTVISKSSAIGGVVGRHIVNVNAKKMLIENNIVRDSHFTITSPNNIPAQLGGISGVVTPGTAPNPCNYSSKEVIIRRNAVSNISLEATNSDAPKIGGLFGQLAIANVENNYINHSIFTFLPANNSNKRIGGLVGAYSDTSASCTNILTKLKTNYAAVSLSPWNASNTFIMGLVGRKVNNIPLTIDLTSNDNYFDSQTSGLVESAPYVSSGLNTASMQSGIPFSGWSTLVWDFQNGSYPVFK